jgi:hypothetical protein
MVSSIDKKRAISPVSTSKESTAMAFDKQQTSLRIKTSN